MDEQVDLILQALERKGLLDETLIVFTADHGDMLGDHNMWRKTYAYEPSAKIPMLMRWPTGLITKRAKNVGADRTEIFSNFSSKRAPLSAKPKK